MEVLSETDSRLLSHYMSSCVVIDEWLSNIKDPVINRLTISSKTWSDGMYVWDSTHIHYVRIYRARLPEDFIWHVKNMIAQGFDVERLSKEKLRAEFELVLKKVVAGNESVYARY